MRPASSNAQRSAAWSISWSRTPDSWATLDPQQVYDDIARPGRTGLRWTPDPKLKYLKVTGKSTTTPSVEPFQIRATTS